MNANAIRFNTETKKYEIGNLRKGKFTVIEIGESSTELATKYSLREVFYDGEYSHLNY